MAKRLRALGALGGAALLLAGCGEKNTYVAPPPPKVTVATPLRQEITPYLEATGNAAAVNSANLFARVQGYLQAVTYKDGDEVKAGTPLFSIEPEPYKLKVEQALAAQASAAAAAKQAQLEFDRQTELASRQVTSKATLDKVTADKAAADAKLKQAELDTEQAKINYGYTQVAAPFDGVVTARQVSVGELVGSGTPTVLATIIQFNPIYVNFAVSEREIQLIRENMARRGIDPAALQGKVVVEVGLQTDNGYPHKGTLDYVAPNVDPTTGTMMARGVFENAGRALLPGYFVRVRIPQQPHEGLLVPDIALGSDQAGRYVLVVNADNVVEQRKVKTGLRVGLLREIEEGLKPQDRIVVEGLLRAIPGQKVDPQSSKISAAAAPAR